MGGSYSKMKKQARLLGEQFSKMQEELGTKSFTGVSGNGLVRLEIDGNRALKSIEIKPDCVDPNDVEGLQDLIKAAFDDALRQLENSSPGGGWPTPF